MRPTKTMTTCPDIEDLEDQLDDAERDARTLVAELTEKEAAWRSMPDSWSVAECIDHLAVANRVYVRAMEEPARRAREQGRLRRRPVVPGLVGRWFVSMLEPPVKKYRNTMKAPAKIVPRTAPSLADAFAGFIESQNEVRTFLRANSDLDLARIRFPNPFIRGVRFSLATGFHVITAHERRHLWQAHRIREASNHPAA